tara:strand:+ start:802 stop:1128 length:327 start_codon:yes stop_codon:yes gene_type:complete
MATIFVIQNQHGHYLGKQQQWLDGRDKRLLFRTAHSDEVANMIFEQSSKDIHLRAQALACELDESNQPIVKAGPPILSAEQSLFDEETDEQAALTDDITPSEDDISVP